MTEIREDEYLDPTDGLIHCLKCGGPRQAMDKAVSGVKILVSAVAVTDVIRAFSKKVNHIKDEL